MSAKDLSGFSMSELFRQEAEAQTAILNSGLLELERGNAAPGNLEALMRAAHSIKGAARIVGLDAAVKVAHAMEDCFVAAQKGEIGIDPVATDVLLHAADLLMQIAADPDSPAAAWRADDMAAVRDARRALAAIRQQPRTQTAAATPLPVPETALMPPPMFAPTPMPAAPATNASTPAPSHAPKPAPEPAPTDAASIDRTARVSTEILSRLLALAGDALVQTRWHDPFAANLKGLKDAQRDLMRHLEKLAGLTQKNAPMPDLAVGLADAGRMLGEIRRRTGDSLAEFEFFTRRNVDLTERMYRETVAGRMRPLADGIQGFPRMVRDLARQLGKQVRFNVVGENTGVDREILARLEAPLTHMLRNALDHGLELPAERQAAGKPPDGTLKLEARHHAGRLLITVSDDGRGIDIEGVRRKALARGLSAPETLARMTEEEVLDFLFLPGFSTAERVSEISGRGVGMDVVRNLAQELNGTVRAESRPGRGAGFTLQLPITMSVLRALLVEVAGAPYAIPLTRVVRVARAAPDAARMIEGRIYLALDGRDVGLVEAAAVLGLPAPENRENLTVVALGEGAETYGLLVDRMLGECKLVVRRMDERLGKVRDVSAVALLDDGDPVIILDTEDILRSIAAMLGHGGLKSIVGGAIADAAAGQKKILVADDSITVREIERRLLENRGYLVDVAVDGMEAWNNLREHEYDLLVTDVDMPRMNGIELTEHVRGNSRVRELPVVIVSYKDQESDRRRGMDAGASYYLTKSSFQDETFVKAVAELLGDAV